MIPMKWRLDGGALSASKPSCNESTNNVYSMLARADKKFTKAYGKHKAFHKGGNSSCCMHIRQHYELYIQKCKKADIPISHWAIPLNIMEEEKEAKMQGKLVFGSPVSGPEKDHNQTRLRPQKTGPVVRSFHF